MKIALIAGYAPSLVRFRGALLATLASHGHKILAGAAGGDRETENSLRVLGVSYHSLPLNRARIDPFGDIRYINALITWFREEQFDVVIAYTHKPIVYAAFAIQASGVKAQMFALVTGLGYAFSSSNWKARMAKIAMCCLYKTGKSALSGVMFQNRDDLLLFERMGLIDERTKRIVVWGSGISLHEFAAAPLTENARREVKFLFVGRLLVDKGLREFIGAARAVGNRFPHAVFDIVGPFDSNPASVSAGEMAEWERQGVVRYHGEQEDVARFMRECSVLVLPSYREGMSRTVMEAMAIGRAIITTDVPGCRDTVFGAHAPATGEYSTGRNGYLVRAKDVKGLCGAMIAALQRPEVTASMGREGSNIARRLFDVNRVNAEMIEFMGLGRAV